MIIPSEGLYRDQSLVVGDRFYRRSNLFLLA